MSEKQVEFISVVIPLHNCEKTVDRAITSVMEQTYTGPIEIICVLNQCTDNTENIVRELQSHCPLIRILKSEPKGIVPTLNLGIQSVNSTMVTSPEKHWIARQDGDDKWYPEKLEKQVAFIEQNPNLDIVGTQMRYVRPNTFEPIGYSTNNPLDNMRCKRSLLDGANPIAHPSVMFRKSISQRAGLYDDVIPFAEDMWLWAKCIKHYKFGNMPDMLMDYTLDIKPHNQTPRYAVAVAKAFREIETQLTQI